MSTTSWLVLALLLLLALVPWQLDRELVLIALSCAVAVIELFVHASPYEYAKRPQPHYSDHRAASEAYRAGTWVTT
jgi:hypothetical protein